MNCSIASCVYSTLVLNLTSIEVTMTWGAIHPGEKITIVIVLFLQRQQTHFTDSIPNLSETPVRWSLVFPNLKTSAGISFYGNPGKGGLCCSLHEGENCRVFLKNFPMGLKTLNSKWKVTKVGYGGAIQLSRSGSWSTWTGAKADPIEGENPTVRGSRKREFSGDATWLPSLLLTFKGSL